MKPKRIYQLKRISGQSEIEVIYAKPVFDNVESLNVCLIMN